mmetsp:Transcript_933/g.2636  ORF Transcript_933/g.2636 Transcript_933/m.2636 type:complete len:239 (+) Transcript_933:271-987(+)
MHLLRFRFPLLTLLHQSLLIHLALPVKGTQLIRSLLLHGSHHLVQLVVVPLQLGILLLCQPTRFGRLARPVLQLFCVCILSLARIFGDAGELVLQITRPPLPQLLLRRVRRGCGACLLRGGLQVSSQRAELLVPASKLLLQICHQRLRAAQLLAVGAHRFLAQVQLLLHDCRLRLRLVRSHLQALLLLGGGTEALLEVRDPLLRAIHHSSPLRSKRLGTRKLLLRVGEAVTHAGVVLA